MGYRGVGREGRLVIIGSSGRQVRVSCEACGAHAVHDHDAVGLTAFCATCGEYRYVADRRRQDVGHSPERRIVATAT